MRNLKFWCQKILPLVYDDSLSYYEVLCKLTDKINEVLATVEQQGETLDDLVNNYEELILSEVNDILTEWIADGTWDNLINNALKKTYLLISDSYGVGNDTYGNQYTSWSSIVANKMADLAEHIYILQGGGWGFTGKAGDEQASETLKWLYNLRNWVNSNSSIVPTITDIVIVGGMNDHYTTSDVIEADIEEFSEYVSETFNNPRMHLGCAGWAGLGSIPLPSGAVSGGYIRQAMRGVVRAYTLASKYNMSYIGNLFECLHVYAPNTVFSPDGYHPNSAGGMFIASAVLNYLLGGNFNANSFGQNMRIAYNHGGRTGNFTFGVSYCQNDTCAIVNGEVGSALPMFTMSAISKNTNAEIGSLVEGCIAGTPFTNILFKLTAQNTDNQVLALLVIGPDGTCVLNPITDNITDGVVYSIEPLTSTFASLNC